MGATEQHNRRSIRLKDSDVARTSLRPYGLVAGSLGAIVRAFKSAAALRFNRMRSATGKPLWQRNYYEHIVRDEKDLQRIRQYIHDNPLRWSLDENNPTIRRGAARFGLICLSFSFRCAHLLTMQYFP